MLVTEDETLPRSIVRCQSKGRTGMIIMSLSYFLHQRWQLPPTRPFFEF